MSSDNDVEYEKNPIPAFIDKLNDHCEGDVLIEEGIEKDGIALDGDRISTTNFRIIYDDGKKREIGVVEDFWKYNDRFDAGSGAFVRTITCKSKVPKENTKPFDSYLSHIMPQSPDELSFFRRKMKYRQRTSEDGLKEERLDNNLDDDIKLVSDEF